MRRILMVLLALAGCSSGPPAPTQAQVDGLKAACVASYDLDTCNRYRHAENDMWAAQHGTCWQCPNGGAGEFSYIGHSHGWGHGWGHGYGHSHY